jgi:hypothetical protein
VHFSRELLVKHANSVIRDAALQDLEFCLSLNQNGQLYMKRNHAYYHQVQFQMLVCRVNICFFIVYTKVDLVALRIRYDEKFCDSILPKCKLFALNVLMPELIGKYFTETRYKQHPVVTQIPDLSETTLTVVHPLMDITRSQNVSKPNVLSEPQNNKLSKSIENSNAVIPNDLNQVNLIPIHNSNANNSSMYSPCFCNVFRFNEDMIICNNISCRVREYHKCCLLKLGKKRFGENWKCDTCKKAAKKSVVKKPLKKIN